jgi:hypothetical protein
MKIYTLVVGLLLSLTQLFAQSNTGALGGEATGSGGTASFTAGEVFYTYKTSASVSVTEGVQQGFGITELTVTGIVKDISCNGLLDGSIDLTVEGGRPPYTYSWSNRSKSQDISSLGPGTYSVTVRDAAGVKSSKSFTVVNPSLLVLSSSQTDISSCGSSESGSITPSATGGKAPYQFSLSTGQELVAGKFIGLTAGTYTLTVRDANDCSKTKSVTINQDSSIAFTSIHSNVSSCSVKGSITVTASGGQSPYQYSKDGGLTWQVSNLFTGLEAKSYPIVVKDLPGCASGIANVIVSDNGSDAYESNNTLKTAKTIVLESSIQARIGVSGDVDWFKYITPKTGSGTYYLIFERQESGQVAQLYQGDGTLIVPSQTGLLDGSSATYGAYTLLSGKPYYIKVSGTTSLLCYTIRLSKVLNVALRILENQSEDNQTLEVQTSEIKEVPEKVNPEDVYDVVAYPNPSNGIFKLALPGFVDGEVRIRIVDGLGRLIQDELGQVENGKKLGEIDLTFVAKGLFYIQVMQEGRAKTIRVVLH